MSDDSPLQPTPEAQTADPERVRRALLQQQQQARTMLRHQKLKISFVGYILVLCFLALLQGIGVFLFTKGFLLLRQVPPELGGGYEDPFPGFEGPPPFQKAVVLVIDALRFDFVVPVPPNHSGYNEFYHNNFPVLHELAATQQNAVLLKFVADPPTTTLQRLKGLTTGSLPTFIDAGLNFNGAAIAEDNWLLQLHRANRSVAFMGDDTWTALFEQYLDPALCFPFESLNVWDLHTVDNGVLRHLWPLLGAASRPWDVLIGHFLGVDHAGHRYGPSHHAMKDKLVQMNAVVQRTIDTLDDDTLLVVMGDHGMDRTGNHGGDSPDELESTLFLYSKRRTPVFQKHDPAAYSAANLGAAHRAVNQIDLVPTLSLLLGVPIPHNNLGFPIDEAFASRAALGHATRATLDQIMRFRNLSKEVQTDATLEAYGEAHAACHVPDPSWEQLAQAQRFQAAFLDHCKSLWARFDLPLMCLGLAALILSFTVLITYSRSIPSVRVLTMSFEFVGSIVAMSLLGLVLSLSIYVVLRPPKVSLRTCLLSGAAGGITIGFWAPIMDRFSPQWLWHQISDFFVYNLNSWLLLSIVFVVLHCLVFASNSFVVWEDKLVNFFIATFGLCCLYANLIAKRPRELRILGVLHSLTFLVLSRAVAMINLCREEQSPYCVPTYKASPWVVALLFVAALVVPKTVKAFYALLASYHAAAPLWIETGLTLLMLANAIYWALEFAENNEALSQYGFAGPLWKPVKLAIARIALFTSLVLANFSWSRGPLCVKIEYSDPAPAESDSPDLPASSGQTPQATILGYNNVYGLSYFLLVLNVAVAVLLVTKPMGALSLSILLVQILTLLELFDMFHLRRNMIAPVMFLLLGYQHFFSTGHQATIPSIQWEVGFMTTQTIVFPFTHLNITLNTFGLFFIVCLSLPLITLWRTPPSAKPITVLSQIITNTTTMMTYQTAISIMSFVFAANFRRHLMVWKIFAPRFMLSAILLVVINVTVIVFTVWFATGRVLTQVNRIFGR